MRDARDSREETTRLNGESSSPALAMRPIGVAENSVGRTDARCFIVVFASGKFRETSNAKDKLEVKREDKKGEDDVCARGPCTRGSFESTDATDEVLSRTRVCRVLGVARGRTIELCAPANRRHRRARRDQSALAPTASS